MSWLFSRALVAEYSAGTCSDGGQSAQSSSTPTPQAYSWRDKTTAAWRRFPSGMTCEPLTGDRGEELLTSFRAGFRAKTLAQPEKERESTAIGQDSGAKWPASLARYDHDSRSWKTRQCSLHGGLIEFSETFPQWGTTRNGELCRQPTPSFLLAIRAYITSAKGSGLSLPTPRSTDGEKGTRSAEGIANEFARGRNVDLPMAITKLRSPQKSDYKGPNNSGSASQPANGLATQAGGKLNPQWVEWLMGWPIGWTDLRPLEMDKFRQWQHLHGNCLPMTNNVTVERM